MQKRARSLPRAPHTDFSVLIKFIDQNELSLTEEALDSETMMKGCNLKRLSLIYKHVG